MMDFTEKAVRSSAVLTTSYVAGTVLENKAFGNQLVIYAGLTIGSLTSAEIKTEFSGDNSTFYQECAVSTTGGTSTVSLREYTFSASGNYRLEITLKDRYVRISAKGTGTVTGSLMAIRAIMGEA